MRKRIYNMVMEETSDNPIGELLTDKELSKITINVPKTKKVKCITDSVYFCFGVRFVNDGDYEIIENGK